MSQKTGILLIFALLFSVTRSVAVSADVDVFQQLTLKIRQRLDLMEAVAEFKAARHLPVEDIEREKKVLEAVSVQAVHWHLDVVSIGRFFQVQMNAAKAIQYRYRASRLFTVNGAADTLPMDEIRKKLNKLGEEIIILLSQYLQSGRVGDGQWPFFRESLKGLNLTDHEKRHLFLALQQVKRKEITRAE